MREKAVLLANVVLERGVIICELPKTDMKLPKHDLNGNLHTFGQMGLYIHWCGSAASSWREVDTKTSEN